MNDLISAALHDHADGEVHIEQLLSDVHADVRRRRRRQRALASGAGAVLVLAAVAGVGSVLPHRPANPVAGPSPVVAAPRPPLVVGLPATASAAELGVDPRLFHLDVTNLDEWSSLSWSSRPGHEELVGSTDSGDELRVEADRSLDGLSWSAGPRFPVTVAGGPAEAVAGDGSYTVQWLAADGIWAQATVTAGDVHRAVAVAEQVRLDRVFRCAVPFRLAGVTARLTKCATDFWRDAGGWTGAGEAWFTMEAGGPEYQVAVGRAVPVVVNDSVDGRAIELLRPAAPNPASVQVRYPYGGRIAYVWGFGPVEVDIVRSLVAAFTPVDGEDPTAWPDTPFA